VRFEGKRFEGPRQDNFRGNDSFRGHDTARPNDRFRGNHARPERRRSNAERSDGSRFDRPGRDGRERFGTRPVVVDAPGAAPTGESERHGLEVAPDLIWGRHSAQAALESGRPIHRIWCTPEMRFSPKFLQLLREAKASGVLVEEVTWARLGQLTGGAVHQGIALQTAAAETLDLPSLIEGCASLGEAPLLMAVDGLTDPHNLGAIVRSAEALGAHGLVLPQRRSAGLTGSVAKVAAGALEHLPVARVVNLNRALDSLKQEGYRVVGLAGEGTVSLEEADLDGPLVIVTGSEGDGLSMLTRRNCDQLVRIPLRGATPSLNASVATALLLYEVARRGWMKGLSGSQPAPRIVRPQLPSQAAAELVEPALPDPADDQLELEAAPPQFPGDRPANEPLDLPQIAPEQPAPEPSSSEQLSPAAAPVLELGLTPTQSAGFQGDIQL
jgi:23S rRNA (guanosine2251-2'-O)-methyltransferase